MMMYSPLGGWQDAPGHEVDDLIKKGWFPKGHEKYVDPFSTKNQGKQSVQVVAESQALEASDGGVAPAQSDALPELRRLWQEKYGKIPHHLKSAKTLRKELGEWRQRAE